MLLETTAPSALLLKLLKKILLIAIRIYYCVILCYLVYKHSYLLTYYSLIYIKIVLRDRLLSFNSIKGNITQSSKVLITTLREAILLSLEVTLLISFLAEKVTTALSALIKLAANKLPCLLLKLLKKILLIAIRIYYCVTLCYLVYKHSCLLTYCSLIYIKIIPRDRLLSFNSIKGNITMFNNSYNNSNSNSNAKI
ncbi:hypothetical protein HBI21_158310 [Parastagonospora nodorum]|nr:hypothetical protein HBI21_158310 [Parastagonospora nodorum]